MLGLNKFQFSFCDAACYQQRRQQQQQKRVKEKTFACQQKYENRFIFSVFIGLEQHNSALRISNHV